MNAKSMTQKMGGMAVLLSISFSNNGALAGIDDAIAAGSVNGNVRAYYNTRDYETKDDTDAFALGGALRGETGPMGWVKLGVGFYTAHDLDTNNSDPAKVNGSLGSDLDVLGEAYVKVSQYSTDFTAGRQIVNTPFANAGDAFIIPFTFEAFSLVNTSLTNVTLTLSQINTIKNRNSEEFVDVGKWSTSRYGVGVESTSGTTVFGVAYADGGLNLQGWYYEFSDLFTLAYAQAGFAFSTDVGVKPFVGLQYGSQSDTGDELLGKVDSMLLGVQGGAGFGPAKLTLAYTTVDEEGGAFGNGAFLAPYSFSTSPLFTNNMLATMENVDSGDAYKITFNYDFPKLKLKLSYAEFDFESAPDREAIDGDVTYDLSEYVKGLSLRWRVEFLTSDSDAVEQVNHRFQAQLTF